MVPRPRSSLNRFQLLKNELILFSRKKVLQTKLKRILKAFFKKCKCLKVQLQGIAEKLIATSLNKYSSGKQVFLKLAR